MMRLLKYFILGLFMLNLPGIGLIAFGSTMGSLLSYSSFLFLIFFYLFFYKSKPNFFLLIIGLSYFLISSFQLYYNISEEAYLIMLAKFVILVIFGSGFFSIVTFKELTICILVGAVTILGNAFLFKDDYGRYAGFYLNPNAAGFVCITGYALSYSLEKGKMKTVIQIIFTVAGLLTFSRTFIIAWLLINTISLFINIKNIKIFFFGISLALLTLTFGELLNLNGLRFKQYQAVLESDKSTASLQEGSRTETWAIFYDEIVNSPILGNGFGKFQGGGVHGLGTHNTYLLIVGEAGIIPLVLFLIFLGYLLVLSFKHFKENPTLLLLTLSLGLYLLTSHNYFDTYFKLCVTMFIYEKINQRTGSSFKSLIREET